MVRGDRGVHAVPEQPSPKRLRDDARLAVELGYCVPLGIPHSQFLSWADDDQDKALAWLQERAQHCSRCGTRPDQWDPAKGGSRFAFYAELDRCLGCEVIDQAQRDIPQGELGVKVLLLPNDDPPDAS